MEIFEGVGSKVEVLLFSFFFGGFSRMAVYFISDLRTRACDGSLSNVSIVPRNCAVLANLRRIRLI